jgi:hypothetical protein
MTNPIEGGGRMAIATLGVVAGLAVWVGVVMAAGAVMRGAWPAYALVADAMTFTLPMMIARLTIGAVATLVMGFTTAMLAHRSIVPSVLSGVLLLLAFIPQHMMLWEKFPVWYHLTFLASLVPLTVAGATLRTRSHWLRPATKSVT